jgi:hypothetical protein
LATYGASGIATTNDWCFAKYVTAFDFTQLSDAWVRKEMSVVGLRLKHDLLGQSLRFRWK